MMFSSIHFIKMNTVSIYLMEIINLDSLVSNLHFSERKNSKSNDQAKYNLIHSYKRHGESF